MSVDSGNDEEVQNRGGTPLIESLISPECDSQCGAVVKMNSSRSRNNHSSPDNRSMNTPSVGFERSSSDSCENYSFMSDSSDDIGEVTVN